MVWRQSNSLFSFDKVSCVFSICGSFWYPDFVTYCREEKVKIWTVCCIYRMVKQKEPIIAIAWLKHQPMLSRSIPVFRNAIRTVSLSLILMDTMNKVAERFLAFPAGWPKNGKSNKRFIPWLLPRDCCIYLSKFFSFLIWIPYEARDKAKDDS